MSNLNKEKSLRARVAKYSRSLKVRTMDEQSRDYPIDHKSDSIIFDGAERSRKRIVLLTSGCGIGTCTMCPFPNESLPDVTGSNIMNQFDNSFPNDTVSDYEIITLFTNGSFFRDAEFSPAARNYVYDKVRNSDAGYLVTESLPQFVTEEKILHAKDRLGGKRLSVFMGLQTSDDFIREVAINTTCTKRSFERACHNLLDNNFIPVSFLMIKPPFLTEEEAIEDTCKSIKYLASVGVSYALLCPTRVAPNTMLKVMHDAGLYSPPWIWSVIEILRRNRDEGISMPMVNTSELKAGMNPDSVCARECPKCSVRNILAIEQFLFSRNFKILDKLSCECLDDYHAFKKAEVNRWKGTTVEDRVRLFLNNVKT